MSSTVQLEPRTCPCGAEFIPAPGGYNAKYCSKRCKTRVRYARVTDDPQRREERLAQRRSYYAEKRASDPSWTQRRNAQSRDSVKKVREWLADYKTSQACVDCGFDRHFAALTLDHLGKKSGSIADMRSSIARLEQEIQNGECVVRCANCHGIKTWAERNGYSYEQYLEEFVQA